ncbi:MAG: phenylalanine--tRNA ligase beta subunit-related protein, partial [Planctomycetota bacterium]|nr:phenylalanine--tRNA ligase beta subunit-related protein [Planctomycetota bacterium]
MYTSATWINEYLDPPATPEEQAELLTRAGFPFEGREALGGSDVRQDFEMTSNRGDCVSHLGLAREIAAISGRALKPPQPSAIATGPPAQQVVTVTNLEGTLCPLYMARVIRGVRVGPSPQWLAGRLRAINQIPRNNIVDASNFVLFELGQPTHVFDLARLAGPQIIVRTAKGGERILPLGEGASAINLSEEDLVIADAKCAVAIAGVKGGAQTAVTEATTDLLIESASFDPATVRRTSRRLQIESDSSFRFERGVHPGQVTAGAQRLVELILELAGGE